MSIDSNPFWCNFAGVIVGAALLCLDGSHLKCIPHHRKRFKEALLVTGWTSPCRNITSGSCSTCCDERVEATVLLIPYFPQVAPYFHLIFICFHGCFFLLSGFYLFLRFARNESNSGLVTAAAVFRYLTSSALTAKGLTRIKHRSIVMIKPLLSSSYQLIWSKHNYCFKLFLLKKTVTMESYMIVMNLWITGLWITLGIIF